MKSSLSLFVLPVSVFLSSGRRVQGLDLKLDIGGGACHNTTEFDLTFDYGIMPGTEEVMDITTTTIDEEAIRKYGYSAFRGDDISNIDFKLHTQLANGVEQEEEEEQGHLRRRRQKEEEDDQEERDLLLLDCPVFKECPGAGDPTHWCAWICGYWQQPHESSPATAQSSTPAESDAVQPQQRRDNNGFLRRVTEDLRIPDAELQQLDEFQQQRQPIRYSPQDRQLWLSIESLVCGWIQRWLDSENSNCLHGATLVECELDLRQ